MSTQLSTANQQPNLTPQPLMGKALKPSGIMRQIAQELKGASDIQIVHKSNAGLRTKQNQAIKLLIEEQRSAVFRQARRGEISESEHQAKESGLRRIRDRLTETLTDWAGNIDPKHGAVGTGVSREFEIAFYKAFNQFRSDLNTKVEIRDVPLGPITGQEAEEEDVITKAPEVVKLDDLPVVEPSFSGPLYEQPVAFDEDGKAIRPDLDLPVFEPEEEGGDNSI